MITIIPSEIIAGDTLTFSRTLSDYEGAAGYKVSYQLVNAAGTVTFAGVDQGSGVWLFDVKPVTTKEYVPGVYAWYEIATKGVDRTTLNSGDTEITPDISTAHDTRTYAEKMLSAIEAQLQSKATNDQQSYSINGRAIGRYPIPDLIALRDKFKAEVNTEQQRQNLQNGLATNKIIRTRL